MKTQNRRQAVSTLGALLCTLSFSENALAGSYLSRSAVLLKGAELEAKALRARFFDKELARVTHRLALVRAEVAREMIVPEEVKKAHPHLLLVMESYERVAAAAVRGSQNEALVALARAREEGAIFVAVLKQGGWDLPRV
jgi:hypothetical protein